MVLGRKGRGFPNLAFLLFPIADEAEDLRHFVAYLQGQSDTVGNGQALPQRADSAVETRQFFQVGMPLERAADSPQRIEQCQGKIAFMR